MIKEFLRELFGLKKPSPQQPKKDKAWGLERDEVGKIKGSILNKGIPKISIH